MRATRRGVMLGTAAALAAPAVARAAPVEISFLFPVAVGGPITKIVDGYARAFEAENPGIAVRPVYAGSYTDTLVKAQTALRAADGPTMAVLLSTDVFTLIDAELVVPFDGLPGTEFLSSFYPAFMANGRIGGRVWGVPFQRSTIVLYWNKAAFRDAGLDPETAPATWPAHAEAARRLSVKDKRWGVEIPGTGFTYWLFQALATQAGATLANGDGTEVQFATPQARTALEYWQSLMQDGGHPPGLVEWATTPRDFLEGRAAMIWHTTGNLSNIRANAAFPFGVAMLPEGVRRGSPTGGGNFYLFKSATEAQREAALRFLAWVTSPARAAQWCIDTGYVATRPDAWETPALRDYAAQVPAATVARDQLAYAVPELSTHENGRVTQALNDALQAALLGRKPAAAALDEAQATATRVLRPFR
jgi:sn-glycerol 3-phosphate transport system substrate-binding protein